MEHGNRRLITYNNKTVLSGGIQENAVVPLSGPRYHHRPYSPLSLSSSLRVTSANILNMQLTPFHITHSAHLIGLPQRGLLSGRHSDAGQRTR